MSSPMTGRRIANSLPRYSFDGPRHSTDLSSANGSTRYWDSRGSYADMDDDGPARKRETSTRKLTRRFANKTSLQGIKFIEDATNCTARSFWILLFIGGLCASLWQLVIVFDEFFEYKVTTTIELGHSTLDFPSVTICNANALRLSTLPKYRSMNDYIKSLRDQWNETPTPRNRRKRGVFPDFDDTGGSPDNEYHYDDYDLDSNEDFGSQKLSGSFQMKSRFTDILRGIPIEDRMYMGHQPNLTILECTFNGYECYIKDFDVVLNTEFGNCFQFNSISLRKKPYKSRLAGIAHGLQLVLYTGYREYLNGYTYGRGFRVVVHPFGSMALPETYSEAVASGSETSIAIRLINITRKGKPYGACFDINSYMEEYGTTYSAAACSSTCVDRFIASRCNCIRTEYFQYYPLKDRKLGPCKSDEEKECAGHVRNDFTKDTLACGCDQACDETVYEKIPSSLAWPNPAVMGNLIDLVCEQDENGPDCDHLEASADNPNISSHELLRENFALLKIYYQELNYEVIKEEAAYGVSQFGADIGGVIGLWLGMSVLSVFEVVHFASQFIYHYCRKTGKRSKPSPPGTHASKDSPKFGQQDGRLGHNNQGFSVPRRSIGNTGLHPGFNPSWDR